MNTTTVLIILIVVFIVFLLFIKNMKDKKDLTPKQTGDIVEETHNVQENKEEKT